MAKKSDDNDFDREWLFENDPLYIEEQGKNQGSKKIAMILLILIFLVFLGLMLMS